jgi:hypothetical protein
MASYSNTYGGILTKAVEAPRSNAGVMMIVQFLGKRKKRVQHSSSIKDGRQL